MRHKSLSRPATQAVILLATALLSHPLPGISAEPPTDAESRKAVDLLPTKYREAIWRQLPLAKDNRPSLLAAINEAPVEQREGMAFLLANMPAADLVLLSKNFLLTNVAYAYKARAEMPWGRAIPDELFLNDVLPYANVNERRDDWRKDFYDRFAKTARECRTPGEAVLRLNKEVFATLKVKYHKTKRPKPDQSPYESTEAHWASCTGLSILLADACRSVCIPARLAGTPLWTNRSGNHTWTEVWDRQWHFIGSAESAPLDQGWFTSNAASADPTRFEHRIYAASFAKSPLWFPMVWAMADHSVGADDVTLFYSARRKVTFRLATPTMQNGAATKLVVRLDGRLVAADETAKDAGFVLAGGKMYDVELTHPGQESQRRRVEVTDKPDQVIELRLAP